MEEAERLELRRQRQEWLDNMQQQERHNNASSQNQPQPSTFLPPSHLPPPQFAPSPLPQQWIPPPIRHGGVHPDQYQQPQQQQPYPRRRPPHPDDYYHPPPQVSYVEYPSHHSHASPEVSPMSHSPYPLYPPPNIPYSNPSPSTSIDSHSPSPYTTPGGSVIPLPSGSAAYGPDLSHMYGAVESARWMANIDGPGEDSMPPPHFPPASYRNALPPFSQPVAAYPSTYAARLQDDQGVTYEDNVDRRPSDSSVASNDSAFAYGRTDGMPNEEFNPNAVVKPFIEKLYGILSRPTAYGECLKWSDSGDSFFVAHSEKFIREVLPEQFCHSNIHSFTRQLNVYNFTRMSVKQLREGLSIPSATTADYSGWSHPLFKRGDTSTLTSLNPRPSRARLLKKLEKQYATSSSLNQQMNAASQGSSSNGGNSGSLDQRRGSRGEKEKRRSMTSIDEYG